MKYLSTPIAYIEISRDGITARVQFTLKNEDRIVVFSLVLTSSDKLFHFLIEDGKDKIEIFSSSRVCRINTCILCITQILS